MTFDSYSRSDFSTFQYASDQSSRENTTKLLKYASAIVSASAVVMLGLRGMYVFAMRQLCARAPKRDVTQFTMELCPHEAES